jgi:MerR family copper efflux transcriptional regulator
LITFGGHDEKGANGILDYLTVQQAAAVLGVSPSTLRNWDRAGKLKARRNPMNGYRLYARDELQKLLNSVKGRKQR